jgi:hypothetical protein
MLRKISFGVLSVAILIIGVIAFSKLGYWDRSIRIFNFSSAVSFPGRMERGHDERGGFDRPESRNLPDRNIPDSLRGNPELRERDHSEAGIRNGQGHRGGDFRGGKKINLKNVLWFLVVLASFTVVTRYIDNGISLIRRRKARKGYLAETA